MDVTTRRIAVKDVELDVIDAGSGPLVVLCHGFPELAHSWRHQIPVLVDAGYRVLAPDQRGYGNSSRPGPVGDYDIVHLTGDIVGLIDWAGAERAVVVGHDWGAIVAWAMARRHADRLAGVVGMSVPFTPRPDVPPTQLFRMILGDRFFYMLWFQQPDVPEADLGADPARFLRRMLVGASGSQPEGTLDELLGADDGRGLVDRFPEPESLPEWLPPGDLDRYVEGFTRSGFRGPINWYRNLDRNWELDGDLADRIDVPALFIAGTRDPVLGMSPPSLMDGRVTDLRDTVLIEGVGHWVQQEAAAEVNTALLRFLRSLAPGW